MDSHSGVSDTSAKNHPKLPQYLLSESYIYIVEQITFLKIDIPFKAVQSLVHMMAKDPEVSHLYSGFTAVLGTHKNLHS
jgi:hypothetical protein